MYETIFLIKYLKNKKIILHKISQTLPVSPITEMSIDPNFKDPERFGRLFRPFFCLFVCMYVCLAVTTEEFVVS